MIGIEAIEQLVERVAQNYSEVVNERNKLRDEIAVKNEEIERIRRECAQEIEQVRAEAESREREASEVDVRLDALRNRLETILEARVSEVLTGGE